MDAYKLRRAFNNFVIAGAATSLLLVPYLQREELKYTEADIANEIIYLEELQSIEDNYNINFKNEELYKLIAKQVGENFTVEDLRKIKTLQIKSLTNHDLSDLKYLINLENLFISDMTVDLKDLQYNQSLKTLFINLSELTNTTYLPNSIEYLSLFEVDITDGLLHIPHNTTELEVYWTYFESFELKAKNNLTNFKYQGFSILDLKEIEECENLTTCTLFVCPNIRNCSVLTTLPKLQRLNLDDYAPIWINIDVLTKLTSLDEDTKNSLLIETTALDDLASSLIPENSSDKEKVDLIIQEIADRLEFDKKAISKDKKIAVKLSTTYNTYPIEYALQGTGVCVNYACFFSALANRVDLTNYQDAGVDHTWNMVSLNDSEYKAYDVTNIDSDYAKIITPDGKIAKDKTATYSSYFAEGKEEELFFYNFDLSIVEDSNNSYDSKVEPLVNLDNLNIGYVANPYLKSEVGRLDIRLKLAKKMKNLIPISLITNILLGVIGKIQERKKRLTK